jgi:signal transduction histidine kinase
MRWLWEQGRGVYDDVTGELLYLDGYITDVTERVEAYENLLLANKELTEANKRSEEAMNLKSQFLSNLSHEIRTPVNAIMGFTQILSEEGLSNDDKNDCLEIIHKSNKSLLKLIDDIVLASKIETNQLKPHISRMTAGELSRELGKAGAQLLQEFEKCNLEITTLEGTSNEGLILFTDKEFVKDIVVRLLDNALRFTEIGFVQLQIFLSEDNSQLFFEVSDQGKGIDKEVEANLFKSFYRADDPINTRTRGAGLGLYISRSCARLLDGELRFIGNSGKGATFQLTVPVTPVLG